MGTLSIRYSERLVMRFGARALLAPGLLAIMAGLVVFARVPVHASYLADVFPAVTLLGIGAGICFPALMNVAMSGAAPEDAGLASGLVNTTAQVGGALGLAILATLSSSRSSHLLALGHDRAAALTAAISSPSGSPPRSTSCAIAIAVTLPRAASGRQGMDTLPQERREAELAPEAAVDRAA